MNKSLSHILGLLLAGALPLFGQGAIRGIVTDSAGTPVSAAAIRLENSGAATITGSDGRFSLSGTAILLTQPRNAPAPVSFYSLQGRELSPAEPQGFGIRYFQVKPGVAAAARKVASNPAVSHDVLTVTKAGYLKYYLTLPTADMGDLKLKLLKEGGPKFSFFVTSYKAIQDLAKTDKGFGGDLRFGETGPGAGLRGADKICAAIAERSMPGSSSKGWRAFLSVVSDTYGKRVDAIDRLGEGPWYDRIGRMLAPNKDDLTNPRPLNGDPTIQVDFPNEDGVPNHRPDPTKPAVDNHHFLTGSDTEGRLYGQNATCMSWTSAASNSGRPRIGFSWPISNRVHWISGQDEGGCGAGVDLDGGGGSDPSNPVVGSGGGYGGFYCFALNP